MAAHDRLQATDVAIKLVRVPGRETAARLREEFEVLATLDHPGVVRVGELGVADGLLYITTALVSGVRLDRHLEQHADGAEALLGDLLGTLAWLHQHGIVHGDLKPANVIVTDLAGRAWPVVIDFGVAWVAGEGPRGVGTPAYMAPEQLGLAAAPATPRSDLHALGRCFTPSRTALSLAASRLVERMIGPRDGRPASASAARVCLGLTGPVPLGRRGLPAGWGDTIQAARAPGAHWVVVPNILDVQPFLRAAQTSLGLAGRRAWVLPHQCTPREAWSGLLQCLGGSPGPDLVRSAETLAVAVADALAEEAGRAEGSEPPVLLSGSNDPGDVPEILTRLLALHPGLHVVFAATGSGPDDRASWAIHRVVVPDASACDALLQGCGLPPAPGSVAERITARAGAGETALRQQLDAWVASGVLKSRTMGWAWCPEALADESVAAEVWASLWPRLPLPAQALVGTLSWLGGAASTAELTEGLSALADSAGARLGDVMVELGAAGWTTGTGHHVELSPAAMSWALDSVELSELPAESLLRSVRAQCAAIGVRRQAPSLAGLRALARVQADLGRSATALVTWLRVAAASEHGLDAHGATTALLAAAEQALAAGAYDEALATGARAARGASGPEARRLIATVSHVVEASNTTEFAARSAAIRARAELALNEREAALRSARDAHALLRAAGPFAAADAVRLDALLVEAAVLGQAGDPAGATLRLNEIAALAAELRDDHALGRAANNLGNVHFRFGRFAEAARAYEAARAAKERTGDLRGQRIALSNRAMVLRELGEHDAAAAEVLRAAEMSGRLRDAFGLAMTTLLSALLALDVGRRQDASAALERLSRLPEAARLGSDLANARARERLAWHDWAGARAALAGLTGAAAEATPSGAAREAWALGYATSVEGGFQLPDVSIALRLDMDMDTVACAEEHPTEGALLEACAAHALAVAGERAGALVALHRALGALGGRLGAGQAPALRLAWRVAALLDSKTHITQLQEVACAYVAELALDGQPDRIEALGLDLVFARSPGRIEARSAAATLTRTPGHTVLQAVLQAVLQVVRDTPWDLAIWAEALRADRGAAGCSIYGFVGAGERLLGRAGACTLAEARVAELCRVVRAGRDRVDQLDASPAALVLALPGASAGPGSGCMVLEWAVGAESPQLPADSLEPGVELGPLCGLAVERELLMRRCADLAVGIDDVRRAHQELLDAHRDEVTRLQDALQQSRTEAELRYSYEGIVHRSPGMRRVLHMVDRLAARDVPVLVVGESGVGKEVVARALHHHSARAAGPFVAENCGAIPTELFEATLFGHVRGAFTGASVARRGLLAAADGGTLFLDELGELRPEHQVKLLRVLEERRVRPVGATTSTPVDFRLLTATNRDLDAMVAAGTFREDLYYRVAVVTVTIPPLRERPEDILPLAEQLLARHSERSGIAYRLTSGAADALLQHAWPGNVRELDNEILRASVLAEGDGRVRVAHLSPRLRESSAPSGPSRAAAWDGRGTLAEALAAVEAQVVRAALERCAGRKASTARLLDVSRPGLDAKIRRHGIDVAALKAATRRPSDE